MQSKVDRIASYLNRVFWSANWNWKHHAERILEIIGDCEIEEMERQWELEHANIDEKPYEQA